MSKHFQRKDRPLARLNRSRLEKLVSNPSSSLDLLTTCGKATQKQFLKDVFRVMDYLVSEMCFVTQKVGVATEHGFLLRTWGNAQEALDLPDWRLKQIREWILDREWVTSKQPRECRTGRDGREEWRGLASIKRVTMKYFKFVGLLDELEEAREAARKTIKKMSNRVSVAVRYLLTPITLLAKFRRRRKQENEAKANQPASEQSNDYNKYAPINSDPGDALLAEFDRFCPG